jgi:hypothetical protein
VHRLLVEEQEDGGTDVAARNAAASARAPTAGAAVTSARSAVRSATTAGAALALREVLGRVVEVRAERLGLAEGLGVAYRARMVGAGRVPVTVLQGIHHRSFCMSMTVTI